MIKQGLLSRIWACSFYSSVTEWARVSYSITIGSLSIKLEKLYSSDILSMGIKRENEYKILRTMPRHRAPARAVLAPVTKHIWQDHRIGKSANTYGYLGVLRLWGEYTCYPHNTYSLQVYYVQVLFKMVVFSCLLRAYHVSHTVKPARHVPVFGICTSCVLFGMFSLQIFKGYLLPFIQVLALIRTLQRESHEHPQKINPHSPSRFISWPYSTYHLPLNYLLIYLFTACLSP